MLSVKRRKFSMIKDLIYSWNNTFQRTPPLGYLLRRSFPQRWFRIHSLPGGKRYPETNKERTDLLHRNQIGAQKVFSPGDSCLVIVAMVNMEANFASCPCIRNFGLRRIDGWAQLYKGIPEFEQEVENFEFYAAEKTWEISEMPEILTAVSNEKIDPILFYNQKKARVFCPYDGGADLIFECEKERDSAKADLISIAPENGLW